jgi:hypothetical protein
MRPFLWLVGVNWLSAAFNLRPNCADSPHSFCPNRVSDHGDASGNPSGVARTNEGCADSYAPTVNSYCVTSLADSDSRRGGQR